MPMRLRLIIISVFLSLCISCGFNVGGGASDHGNEKVAGIITYPDGSPAAGAEVTLLPADYNHITDSSRIQCRTVVSDNNGRYRFDSLPEGEYALEAVEPFAGTAVSMRGIHAENGETDVLPLKLEARATICFQIDTLPIGMGMMLYMPGLRYFRTIDTVKVTLSNVSPGLAALRGYDPATKREIDLGRNFYAIEIRPGYTLILSKESPKPFCIRKDTIVTEEVIIGRVGEELVFAPIDPSATVNGSLAYQFSWGDGTISEWSSDTRWKKRWDEPGVYFVQSQLMYQLKYLAWSECITVEIRGEN